MNVLMISVHPDDETLGAGGTLLKHGAAGDEIHWHIVTRGFEPKWPREVLEEKEREIAAVAEAYGMRTITRGNHSATALDQVAESALIDSIRDAIQSARPETVYLVHEGDVHSDHRATFAAVMSVLKTMYMIRMGVRRVLSFETLSSTEAAFAHSSRAFMPTVYSQITAEQLERKIEIMDVFASESQDPLMPRGASALRAQARLRGASIGVEYAEAFQLLREVW